MSEFCSTRISLRTRPPTPAEVLEARESVRDLGCSSFGCLLFAVLPPLLVGLLAAIPFASLTPVWVALIVGGLVWLFGLNMLVRDWIRDRGELRNGAVSEWTLHPSAWWRVARPLGTRDDGSGSMFLFELEPNIIVRIELGSMAPEGVVGRAPCAEIHVSEFSTTTLRVEYRGAWAGSVGKLASDELPSGCALLSGYASLDSLGELMRSPTLRTFDELREQ